MEDMTKKLKAIEYQSETLGFYLLSAVISLRNFNKELNRFYNPRLKNSRGIINSLTLSPRISLTTRGTLPTHIFNRIMHRRVAPPPQPFSIFPKISH
jgi:hypothetical protein